MSITLSDSGQTVLQCVSNTYSTQIQSSSLTDISLGLTATITPLLTNSQILIILNMPQYFVTTNGSGLVKYTIYKNGVSMTSPTGVDFSMLQYSSVSTNLGFTQNSSMIYRDFNNSTTSLTYKLYGAIPSYSNLYLSPIYNPASGTSFIHLLEIA
jgi:hypothetical protein